MATWGRSTDIEFVFWRRPRVPQPGRRRVSGDRSCDPALSGKREGAHPLLWVSTDNNMFSDNGPDTAVRFAPAPHLVTLHGVSRESVMDSNPWLYEVMSAELSREARIDAGAQAGSGKVADPRRFAYLEACGEVQDATIAFDIAVQSAGKDVDLARNGSGRCTVQDRPERLLPGGSAFACWRNVREHHQDPGTGLYTTASRRGTAAVSGTGRADTPAHELRFHAGRRVQAGSVFTSLGWCFGDQRRIAASGHSGNGTLITLRLFCHFMRQSNC